MSPLRFSLGVCSGLALACAASLAVAQQQPPGGGTVNPFAVAGVYIDAEGVLRTELHADPSGALMQQRRAAARAALGPKVAGRVPLRKISLVRLERAVAAQIAAGRKPTDEMRYLAGLTRVQYLFLYPETGDIVIAGPAEGWVEDLAGRVVGIETGRPVILLEDLVVALRAFHPDQEEVGVIGCSIDPTEEGLARMQDFLRNVGRPSVPGDPVFTQYYVDGLRSAMGMQTVRVIGVSPATHFAQVLVEADYRMKLIGLGVERPPVKMTTYVDRLTPAMGRHNALTRWFFVPDYACVRPAPDGTAMELVGETVKLVGEGELVSTAGQRSSAGKTNAASRAFTEAFTKKYPEIAKRAAVYAQLRNLIDLAVVSAFMLHNDYYDKAGWKMDFFRSEERFAVETYPVPTQVETVVTSLWKGGYLTAPMGGGVHIDAEEALADANLLRDNVEQVLHARKSIGIDALPPDQWWWD
jgi:hypothetical protein